ncbi:expressed protein [Phakopsora pachyrhizi]|uniref:Expressed protein n=1 Tax=Phakopsora pachyrhizi TaxID=170000 RepID=A0AAV0AS86_PHAPC|nr:expressed protein [Phakopsora pachyrhizi]
MKRSHSAKSHEGCKSCKPEANSPYFLDTELPPYESGSSVSYLQLPLSAAGSGKFSYNSGYNTDTEKSYEGENCSGPSSYPSKKFITTPTPIPVPTTPTFYRSTSSSNSLGSTPSVSASRTDASGLSSPLQKAIQRLADLAGIVGDSSSSENFQLIPFMKL